MITFRLANTGENGPARKIASNVVRILNTTDCDLKCHTHPQQKTVVELYYNRKNGYITEYKILPSCCDEFTERTHQFLKEYLGNLKY